MSVSAIEALGRLRSFGKTIVTTSDVALYLGQTGTAASWTLARLAKARLVRPLRHGLWSLDYDVDPLLLPDYLTAPLPAYVSFQSALSLHGMISQIPHVIYVASLAPTHRIQTTVGVYSIHRLAPSFFGGFETSEKGVRPARPEKALLDTLYLGPSKSRLFARLPEIELPRSFSETSALAPGSKTSHPGPRRLAMERRLPRDSVVEPPVEAPRGTGFRQGQAKEPSGLALFDEEERPFHPLRGFSCHMP